MRALERRLVRVEARLGSAAGADCFEHLTDDELEIAILDLSRRVVVDPTSTPEEIAEARARIASVEQRIISTARIQQSPEYQRHIAWLGKLWDEEKRGIAYVCDLLDVQWGYGDWEKPNVMVRRQALRERPDIAALIREGASSSTPRG